MKRSLVLNASYEPLSVVTARRAAVLVLKQKAEVLHAGEEMFRSESLDVPAPTVIRLNYFVYVPYRSRASLSRRAVFVRDGHACQYCGKPAENIDHVLPRSRGGRHTWENVVASCRPCNSKKENRTPAEAGMYLPRAPFVPKERAWVIISHGNVHPEWEPYLQEDAVSA